MIPLLHHKSSKGDSEEGSPALVDQDKSPMQGKPIVPLLNLDKVPLPVVDQKAVASDIDIADLLDRAETGKLGSPTNEERVAAAEEADLTEMSFSGRFGDQVASPIPEDIINDETVVNPLSDANQSDR